MASNLIVTVTAWPGLNRAKKGFNGLIFLHLTSSGTHVTSDFAVKRLRMHLFWH
jgi:hypothetical protein